ncbi:MAG TPA: prepilin peptidase [Candidatus Binataceae bacterium]|nr:prepilin peptidase [Candidatus Binataceae bacterium]
MDLPRGLGALFAFMLGACVGSFVNVVAYRLPREISIITPRSYCPRCNRPIPVWANIPILAYIGLRGRCLMCGSEIPFRYFLTELALATAAAYLFLSYPLGDALARLVFCATLYVVALIDYDWRVIPNLITFLGIPIGILSAWLLMPDVGLTQSLIGAIGGAGFLFITGEVYLLVRRMEGVGLGDVFLIGMIGAFLGWPGMVFTMFGGSLLGALGGVVFALAGGPPATPEEEVPAAIAEVTAVRRGDSPPPGTDAEPSLLRMEVPFGPFLALTAAFYALFQTQLVHWYLS